MNNLVESAFDMFNGRLEGIRVRTSLAHDLPEVMADPDAIKRAVANLVDNAAEAMQDMMFKEITISTSLVASRDAVELTCRRHWPWGFAGSERAVVSALLFDQETGNGTGFGDCEPHCGRPSWIDSGGGKQAIGNRFVVELPVRLKASALRRQASTLTG